MLINHTSYRTFNIYQFCRAMRPKNNFSMFIFYYWQYLYDKGIFLSNENGTTGIKNLDNSSGFNTSEQFCSRRKFNERVYRLINPLFDKINI